MKRSWLTTVCVLVLTAAMVIGCAYVPVQQPPAQPPAATDKEQVEPAATEEKQEEEAEPAETEDDQTTKDAPAVEAAPKADEEDSTPIDPALARSGKPWIDASAKEALSEDMELSPRDNFYLYVN